MLKQTNKLSLTTFLIFLIIFTLSVIYSLIPLKLNDHQPTFLLPSSRSMIIFTFNKPVIPASLDILIEPSIAGDISYLPLQSMVIFHPSEDYQFSTEYYITISSEDKTLSSFQLLSPSSSTNTEALNKNALSVKLNYPLAYDLPYEDELMKVKYIDKLTLQVTLFDSSANITEDYVRTILQNNGIDPADHQIIFD